MMSQKKFIMQERMTMTNAGCSILKRFSISCKYEKTGNVEISCINCTYPSKYFLKHCEDEDERNKANRYSCQCPADVKGPLWIRNVLIFWIFPFKCRVDEQCLKIRAFVSLYYRQLCCSEDSQLEYERGKKNRKREGPAVQKYLYE